MHFCVMTSIFRFRTIELSEAKQQINHHITK
uniref:Uncharacterized protein n=1 Tax=Anguilla anguilla TaxID=7936 RepID=A0A0E9TCT0_ANGAN